MRAVLDTNVLISRLLWRGARHECLLSAEAGLYEWRRRIGDRSCFVAATAIHWICPRFPDQPNEDERD
jgi:predicted nucleic acid-binding protein